MGAETGRGGDGGRRQPVRRPPRGLPLARLLTVGDETDETGRLLLEDSAPEAARRKAERAGVPMQTVSCPYRDTPSRFGGPMNQSAYETLRRDTVAVLDGFAWLHEQCVRRDPTSASTVPLLATLSKVGTSLPLVLLRRGREPFAEHGDLPSFVASMFKTSRGVFSVAVDMVADPELARQPTSGAELVRYADAHGHLARPDTGRVCAAPTRLIERTLDAMLSGDRGDPAASRLPELVSFEMLWAFYRLERALNKTLRSYGRMLQQMLAAHGATNPAELMQHRVQVDGVEQAFGEVTDGVLERVTAIQAELNRVLERDTNAPAFTFRSLLKAL